MKRIILLLLVLCSRAESRAQENDDCGLNRLTLKWVASNDFYERPGPFQVNKHLVANFDANKMKPRLATALSWVQKMSAGVTGAPKATYYNNFITLNTDPSALAADPWYQATGLLGYYYLHIISNSATCEGKSMLGLLGPAWINVYFNHIRFIAKPLKTSNEQKEALYTIGNKPVFMLPVVQKSGYRSEFYEYPGNNIPEYVVRYDYYAYAAIIIRNSDKPLFIPVTRKQYLEQYRADMERAYKKQRAMVLQYTTVTPPEEIDKQYQERVAEIKKLTEQGAYGYSPSSLEHRLKVAEEFFKNKKEEEANKIKNLTQRMDEDFEESNRLIQNYLSKPQSELDKPVYEVQTLALYEPQSIKNLISRMEGDFGDRHWQHKQQACIINPDYFNPKLPPDVPQLIAIEFVNNQNIHQHLNAILNNMLKTFQFNELHALLNPGQQPQKQQQAPVVVTAKKYLPKKDSLQSKDPVGNAGNPMLTQALQQLPAPGFPTGTVQVRFPSPSPVLAKLSVPATAAEYTAYLQQLAQSIQAVVTAPKAQQLNQQLHQKQLTTPADITRVCLELLLKGNVAEALYLSNRLAVQQPGNALVANNLAVVLTKAGYPEKALPLINYWMKKYPRSTLLLSNAADAYYYLGDFNRARQLAQQVVAVDSLHPMANKLLALVHYKNGNMQVCKGFLERSLESVYDQEVVNLLHKIDPNTSIAKRIYEGRKGGREPLLIKKFQLPKAIGSNAEAETQGELIKETLASINATLTAMEKKKRPDAGNNDAWNAALTNANNPYKKGIHMLQVIAQNVCWQSAMEYNQQSISRKNELKSKLDKHYDNYMSALKSIQDRYKKEMEKLEGGTAKEEAKIMQLQKAECLESNQALDNYFQATALLINMYASDLEYISRLHHSTLANWMPIWMGSTDSTMVVDFQASYLKDMREILLNYPTLKPQDCSIYDLPEDKTEGKLMVWEDINCPVKFIVSAIVIKGGITCNTITIAGGEFIQGEIEVKMKNDWSGADQVTVAAGVGVSWELGIEGAIGAGAEISSKNFITIGKSKTGEIEVLDFGNKIEATVSTEIGSYTSEVKLTEVTLGYLSGVSVDGVVPKALNLR